MALRVDSTTLVTLSIFGLGTGVGSGQGIFDDGYSAAYQFSDGGLVDS